MAFALAQGGAGAADCLSNATGNWNSTATWAGCTGGNGTPANTPGSNDTATIRNGHTVTLTAAAAASSVSITSAAGAGTTSILSVAGQALTIGGGTGGLTISGGAGTRRARLAISTGTVNAGAVSVNGANAQITFSGAGTLNLTGNLQSGGTFTASTGTVHFTGTAAQTIGAYAYNTLRVNNAAGASLTGASSAATLTIGDVTANSLFSDNGFPLTSTGILNLTSGTLKLGGATATSFPAFATRNIAVGTTVEYAAGPNGQIISTAPAYQNLTFSGAGSKSVAAGTLSVMGTWLAGSLTRLDLNNPAVSVTGDLTGTGSITQGTALMTIGGNWLNTGAFTAGTGGVTLTGASRQITGDPANGIAFSTLTVDGSYTNNNGNTTSGVTVSAALGGTGTLTQAANAVLSLGGTSAITNLDASTNPNTVIYNGAAAQSVKATTYHHLTISNASASSVALAGDASVNGTLTLTAGDVSTGVNKLTIKSAGSVTGAGTARHIVGNLEREFLAAGSFTYDVGDGTNYSPISVNVGPLSAAGALTIAVINTDHPDTAAVASGIDPSRSINRYWSLTRDATFDATLAATFNYIDPLDRDAAAVAANFVVRRGAGCSGAGATRTCSSWSAAAVSGTPTNTQATASGIVVNAGAPHADCAIGEAFVVIFSREPEFIYSRELY